MSYVAKRKLTETWREAVARRGAECGVLRECLTAFDGEILAGRHEAEAAYAALARCNILFRVPDGAGQGPVDGM